MFETLGLPALIGLFVAAGAVIFVAGIRMTGLADRLADRTGLGEAVAGAVLLGAATSFSGSIVSLTAALDGHAALAFSNGIGGIAVQTAFLALADLVYRRANLEHAAAELANLFQCVTLFILLMLPLLAHTAPEVAIWGVHPLSLAIPVVYAIGVRATGQVRSAPMWRPVGTRETRTDAPDEARSRSGSVALLVQFAVVMLFMGVAGWVIAKTAESLILRLDLSQSLVGALMTAVVTSLPELVTTLAAVRRRALQLAVGGIIGGNTFDTLFLTISDIGYRDGPIYAALGPGDFFWLVIGALMTAVLLAGLILRERNGPARMGLESVLLLAIYAAAVAVQVWRG